MAATSIFEIAPVGVVTQDDAADELGCNGCCNCSRIEEVVDELGCTGCGACGNAG